MKRFFWVALLLIVGCTPNTVQVETNTPAVLPTSSNNPEILYFNPTPNPAVAMTMTAMPEPLDALSESFISCNPCVAPCFMGITLGISNYFEAEEVFSDSNLFLSCRFFETNTAGDLAEIRCENANVYFGENDFVEYISFSPKSLDLGLIIERFGNPDGVFVVSPIETDAPWLSATLFFHNLNMIVSLDDIPWPGWYVGFEINPVVRVSSIEIFSHNLYEKLKNIHSEMHSWEGYKTYPEIIVPWP